MLHNLSIFKNQRKKNTYKYNKVSHTLLSKEQFKYLKTAHSHHSVNKSSRFITQKRLFNTRSIYKKVSEYLSAISEDNRRYNNYFEKRFPKSLKYLPRIKFVTFLFILITIQMDYQTYLAFFYSILVEGESSITAPPKFYSKYSFCFYFVIIIYEFVLSVYVALKYK